jgi:hypothetical protein
MVNISKIDLNLLSVFEILMQERNVTRAWPQEQLIWPSDG